MRCRLLECLVRRTIFAWDGHAILKEQPSELLIRETLQPLRHLCKKGTTPLYFVIKHLLLERNALVPLVEWTQSSALAS